MPNLINRITNANIYLNGVTMLGRAEEVELPQPKMKMVEHKGLGLVGSPKFPAGLEELKAKIKWSSLYTQVLGVAFQPFQTTALMVRADMMSFGPLGLQAETPVVAFMTGIFDEMPKFKVTRHENSDNESGLTVYYYMLMVGGAAQVEIDVMANVFKVQGIDQLANYRAIQG